MVLSAATVFHNRCVPPRRPVVAALRSGSDSPPSARAPRLGEGVSAMPRRDRYNTFDGDLTAWEYLGTHYNAGHLHKYFRYKLRNM